MEQSITSDANFKTALMAHMAITDARTKKDDKVRASPTLFYKGERIIHLDDFAYGLHLTKKTVRKYRDDGILEVYESVTGNIAFVTQEAFNSFIDNHFISSRHPDYQKLKKKQNTSGRNAK